MKPVYWRPQKVSATTISTIGITAVLALIAVELSPRFRGNQQRKDQQTANWLAQQCRNNIRTLRREKGLKVNRLFDPTQTGVVGVAMSSITSKPANLEAKQLSLHPQFPGAIVQMLHEAGVRRGDSIAVAWTGSFPGLNVALASAIETLELKPQIVASVTASQYGANEPALTWLDMESSLREAGLVSCKSKMATIGGPADRGKGMSDETIQNAEMAAQRNNVKLIRPKRLRKSIATRTKVLESSTPIAAYINVGGGVASCGGRDGVFLSGVNRFDASLEPVDCVMQRCKDQGLAVIHLADPRSLGRRYGLSQIAAADSAVENIEAINYGTPNRWLATLALSLICGTLWLFVLSDNGNRNVRMIYKRLRGEPAVRPVGQQQGPQLMA